MEAKNLITLDPLVVFPPEIFEIIFNNFSGSDLLTALQLNSSWYDYVMSAEKIFKEKLKVKLNCNSYHDINSETLKALSESGRKFDQLEVECCIHCLDKIYGLLNSQEFKIVKIRKSSFVAVEAAIVFFNLIQNTVEHIDMSEVQIKLYVSDGQNHGLTFPRLKTLKIHNIQFLISQNIFGNVTTLEELSITCQRQTVKNFQSILNLLKQNKDLKSLNISGGIYRQLFHLNVTSMFSFSKLEKISIKDFKYGEVFSDMERVYGRFANFLKQNSETLKEISIDKCMGKEVLKTILELPKLEKFEHEGGVDPYLEEDWTDFILKPNESINSLSLSSNNGEIFQTVIQALPRLKLLKCDQESKEISDFLKEHCKKATGLKIEEFKEDRMKIFDDMEQFMENLIYERFGRS